jgi:hypothetical protein
VVQHWLLIGAVGVGKRNFKIAETRRASDEVGNAVIVEIDLEVIEATVVDFVGETDRGLGRGDGNEAQGTSQKAKIRRDIAMHGFCYSPSFS